MDSEGGVGGGGMGGWGGILIFQGVLSTSNFLLKFPVLGKICGFHEGPKI